MNIILSDVPHETKKPRKNLIIVIAIKRLIKRRKEILLVNIFNTMML